MFMCLEWVFELSVVIMVDIRFLRSIIHRYVYLLISVTFTLIHHILHCIRYKLLKNNKKRLVIISQGQWNALHLYFTTLVHKLWYFLLSSYELKKLPVGLFLTHFAPFHFLHTQKRKSKIDTFLIGLYIYFSVCGRLGYLVNIANNSANVMILVLQKVWKVKVLSWVYKIFYMTIIYDLTHLKAYLRSYGLQYCAGLVKCISSSEM